MEGNRLDVYMTDGQIVDVKLNDTSVWPVWFKIEWKGNGELSAKVQGARLSTARGDEIQIHQASELPAKAPSRAAQR